MKRFALFSHSRRLTTGRTPLIKFLGKRSTIKNEQGLQSMAVLDTTSKVSTPSTAVTQPAFSVMPSAAAGAAINEKFKDIPNSNMRKVIAKRLTEV